MQPIWDLEKRRIERQRQFTQDLDPDDQRNSRSVESEGLRRNRRAELLDRRRRVRAPDENDIHETNLSEQDILAVLSQPEQVISIEQLNQIRKMLSGKVINSPEQLIKYNVIHSLSTFLDNNDPNNIEQALWCLSNIAATDGENTKAVAYSDAFAKILLLMEHPNEQISQQAIWCIANISGESQDLLQYCDQHGVGQKAVDIIKLYIKPHEHPQHSRLDQKSSSTSAKYKNALKKKPCPAVAHSVFLLSNLVRRKIKDVSSKADYALVALCNVLATTDFENENEYEIIQDCVEALNGIGAERDQSAQ
ncbi:MAG: hypothetical protein EZS28_019973, partial [Streblomastix strix]